VTEPTHPAYHVNREKASLCGVCKEFFNTPTPTRLELVTSFVGAKIAEMIDVGFVLGSHPAASENLELDLEDLPPLARRVSGYEHWIKAAFLITGVETDKVHDEDREVVDSRFLRWEGRTQRNRTEDGSGDDIIVGVNLSGSHKLSPRAARILKEMAPSKTQLVRQRKFLNRTFVDAIKAMAFLADFFNALQELAERECPFPDLLYADEGVDEDPEGIDADETIEGDEEREVEWWREVREQINDWHEGNDDDDVDDEEFFKMFTLGVKKDGDDDDDDDEYYGEDDDEYYGEDDDDYGPWEEVPIDEEHGNDTSSEKYSDDVSDSERESEDDEENAAARGEAHEEESSIDEEETWCALRDYMHCVRMARGEPQVLAESIHNALAILGWSSQGLFTHSNVIRSINKCFRLAAEKLRTPVKEIRKRVSVESFTGGPCDESNTSMCLVVGEDEHNGFIRVQDPVEAIIQAYGLFCQTAMKECENDNCPGDSINVGSVVRFKGIGDGDRVREGVIVNNDCRTIANRLHHRQQAKYRIAAEDGVFERRFDELEVLKPSRGGKVLIFWGTAQWTRTQLLGEIARGHWGLVKSEARDVADAETAYERMLDRGMTFAPVTEMTEDFVRED